MRGEDNSSPGWQEIERTAKRSEANQRRWSAIGVAFGAIVLTTSALLLLEASSFVGDTQTLVVLLALGALMSALGLFGLVRRVGPA